MTEEFRLNLAEFVDGCDKLRRRGGIVFHEDRKKRLDDAIKVSMDDLLKAQGDVSFVKGVKSSAHAIARLLDSASLSISGFTGEYLEVWLAHIVSAGAECGCDISTDWDSGYEIDLCKAYQDKDFQRLWYLAYFGLTEEELVEREREAARLKAEEVARREEQRRAERLRQLHQLASDFGVDPKYLP